MITYRRIKELRKKHHLSQDELAKMTGYTDRSSIAKIEAGLVDLQQSKLTLFAEALQTTPAYLMGWDDVEEDTIPIPVYGCVAAGMPIEANQDDIIGEIKIPRSLSRRGDFYALEVHGDSMEPMLFNGDTVLIREQPDAENGELVVATINGDDAVCKKLYKIPGGGIQLHSLNPAYDPYTFDAESVDSIPVRILGKVIEMRRSFA